MPTIDIIALSAATTGIATTGALTAIRTDRNKRSRLFLCLIFGLFAGITSLPLTIAFIDRLYVFHLSALLPMLLALPPAIYHYVNARTAKDRTLRLHWRDYLLPISGVGVMLGYWLLPKTPRATMLINGELPLGFSPSVLAIATLVLILLWSLTSFGYLFAVIRRLRIFRTWLRNYYSNIGTYELRWVDWLMAFLVALWGVSAVSLVSDNLAGGPLFSASFIYVLAAALLLFLIAFIATAPPIEEPESTIPSADDEDTDKYAKSALSEDQANRIAARIEDAMRNDALYLDANLSLIKLSRHVGALPNMVSQTLNEIIGSTFYDYVAHWRIEAAKPRILAGGNSILEISLDAGFNSRSTFYKTFKRETGMTPKAYRSAHGSP